jgi:hypothetical protein
MNYVNIKFESIFLLITSIKYEGLGLNSCLYSECKFFKICLAFIEGLRYPSFAYFTHFFVSIYLQKDGVKRIFVLLYSNLMTNNSKLNFTENGFSIGLQLLVVDVSCFVFLPEAGAAKNS